MLTRTQVLQILNYDPITGNFIRIVPGKNKVGTVLERKGSKHLSIFINGYKCYAHRVAWLVMTGEWPKDQIDHINGNGLDNRFCNLREATHSQNQINKPKRKNTTSKYKGVSWISSKQKYRSQISINGVHYHLGYYSTEEYAYKKYLDKAEELHKQFLRYEIIE